MKNDRIMLIAILFVIGMEFLYQYTNSPIIPIIMKTIFVLGGLIIILLCSYIYIISNNYEKQEVRN